ncbi:aldo/keto reductase [Comamonas flocculans]|uniref:Aldo/keto reductase n=1 Tax=Comamonas flocculans TaxID=2597701 RepID=A0A5B8RY02_9BURK|nr:aldo/keto reductase [Comamonas flocculans]QEA13075.1 aldo/keto reductase [Comamonas flocculans]
MPASLLPHRPLGPFSVSAIALGCMGLSHGYGQRPDAAGAKALVHAALDAGVTLFDTAALYGFGANESLLGPLLRAHRARITLASKGGLAGVPDPEDGVLRRSMDGRPEAIRRDCEASLRRLGTEVIDLYYLHRWDRRVPIEESVGAMARLKQEGKIRALGLSEVAAATLRRAQREHPIAALQSEYSLWSRNAELGTLAACKELGIAYVAFSPLGRGFLAGALQDPGSLQAGDLRTRMPRFAPDAFARNRQHLLAPLQALAQRLGCTPAQLALAWLLHQGDQVIALTGTTQAAHLHESLGAAALALDAATLAELDALFAPERVAGERYALAAQREVDTEKFPFESA